MDAYTRAAITDYLRRRRNAWPTTNSPYLLINSRTVHTGRPVTYAWMHSLFKDLPVTAWQLRDDRLLEEAAHNSDPLHLSAVFGITAITSLRFIKALHSDAAFGIVDG